MNEKMPLDRTVKGLLALIAVALWGLLLRPLLNLPAVQAAPPVSPAASVPAIAIAPSQYQALVVQDGIVYRIDYPSDTGMSISAKLKLQ